MDFVPRLVRKRVIGKDEYEAFGLLLNRANTWLEDHSNVQLVSCETITWCGASNKEIFSDSSSFRRLPGVTTYIRGIRFWYLTPLVPTPSRGSHDRQLVRCLTVPARESENVAQLMKRTNDRIADAGNSRVVSVETIKLSREDGPVGTETTIWKEDTTDTKLFTIGIRVYSIVQQNNSTQELIGYQDFIPEKTARSKDNRGYELHSDVMERAGMWIARQQGVRFTNLQTVPIKFKKQSGYEERCSFTEHGRHATIFLHIVRAYFVIRKTNEPSAALSSTRLTYRTFSPVQLGPATSNAPPKYEDVRTLLDRINHWLQLTGAHLFSMETLPVRLTMGSNLGSNATFVPNRDGTNTMARYLYCIRIYVNGDYMEPPNATALVF
jgi:hypothetical protein